jgi:hypothetical protein
MCFKIDPSKKTCNKKVGWKIVQIDTQGYLKSLLHQTKNHLSNRKSNTWQPDVPMKRSKGPTTCGNRSSNGIYVYLTKRKALMHMPPSWMTWRDEVLLRVHLDPKDFIQMNSEKTVATYEKVTPCKEQPYLDWD